VRARVLLALLLCVAPAFAAENLPSDDPRWDQLLDVLDRMVVPDPLGGVQSLDEARANQLLYGAQLPAGFWLRPVNHLAVRALASDEHDRNYSLPARPRNIAGGIAISCEYQEGRPCGDGAFAGVELDSSAGFDEVLSVASRLRLSGGSAGGADGFDVDRLYLKLDLDPFSVQIGRDVLATGPSVRSALMVSQNAAPQDGIRLRLRPVPIFTSDVRFSAFYFIDRLRDPQTFHHTLLDLMRAQIDLWDRFQVGGSRSLQIGGDGAPDYGGASGFIQEHFGRNPKGAGVENNRLSFDFALRIPEWRAARIYYETVFEDTSTTHLLASIRYDADHLAGIEFRTLDFGPLRRFFAEVEHTGFVSQEHSLFRTGNTNDGRTLGTALGPDGTSVWARADFVAGPLQLSPWAEWLRFVSDRYDADKLVVIALGPQEHRQRLGLDGRALVAPGWQLLASAFGERIGGADLQPGSTKYSLGLRAALIWTP
jgi:hypothetical protein